MHTWISFIYLGVLSSFPQQIYSYDFSILCLWILILSFLREGLSDFWTVQTHDKSSLKQNDCVTHQNNNTNIIQGSRQVAASPHARYVSCQFRLLAFSFDFDGLFPPCSSHSLPSACAIQSQKTCLTKQPEPNQTGMHAKVMNATSTIFVWAPAINKSQLHCK